MILVCGGAGYIGSHTVYELMDRGEAVVIVDNLETGHREALHPDALFLEGDIRDREFLQRVFSDHSIEAVMHFAAHSLVGESVENPLKYYDNNVHGTQVLLEKMNEHQVAKMVFSSTAAVYGEPQQIPIQEEDRTKPANPYGETKLAVEKILKWADQAYGIKYISLRYFNVAGAHQSGEIGEDHQPETHLVPLILQVPLGKKPHITIFGDDYDTPDGTCIRDYIHVTDLARAHILALEMLRKHPKSNIYNLGNGEGFSVKEVIEAARRVTGHPIPQVVAPRRAGDPSKLVASAQRAQRELRWKPQFVSMEEIIQSAWQWHLKKPQGFDK